MRQLRIVSASVSVVSVSAASVDQWHPPQAKDSRSQLLGLAVKAPQAISGQRHPHLHILRVKRTTWVVSKIAP